MSAKNKSNSPSTASRRAAPSFAHRFYTTRNATIIHVLQDGNLVASGSHEELIRDSDGLYAYLYQQQYAETDFK